MDQKSYYHKKRTCNLVSLFVLNLFLEVTTDTLIYDIYIYWCMLSYKANMARIVSPLVRLRWLNRFIDKLRMKDACFCYQENTHASWVQTMGIIQFIGGWSISQGCACSTCSIPGSLSGDEWIASVLDFEVCSKWLSVSEHGVSPILCHVAE